MKSNNIIQSFWYGDSLSPLEQLCIRSFLDKGHEFHLYCYSKIKNVPRGCLLKNANEIIDKSNLFFDSRNAIASFADYFRMKLLYLKGHWWVDMDIICLNRFDIENQYAFSSEYVGVKVHPNIGCIKVPKHSIFTLEYLKVIETYLATDQPVIWGLFGPKLMNKLLSLYESAEFIHLPEDFITPDIMNRGKEKALAFEKFTNPISDNEFKRCQEESYSIHFFNELWRARGLSKEMYYHHESLFERLKRQYCIDNIFCLGNN